MDSPNLLIAFGAGALSFMTPCCLPIFPSFLSYVTGVSVDELSTGTTAARRQILKHSLAFFVGFSAVYVAIGLTASALSELFFAGRSWLPVVGGIWVIIMGLAMMQVVRIPFLMRERRIQLSRRPAGYLGSVAVGLAYAAGWTPCVGPILGAVVALAALNPGRGALLLFVYSVGFAVPFVALAYALGSVKVLARYSVWVERIGGALMVVMGLLLATGYMKIISSWLLNLTDFTGF